MVENTIVLVHAYWRCGHATISQEGCGRRCVRQLLSITSHCHSFLLEQLSIS
ncbi:hypothetical protein Plhal304r1_c006g0023641 [Plasmopara halstedii]